MKRKPSRTELQSPKNSVDQQIFQLFCLQSPKEQKEKFFRIYEDEDVLPGIGHLRTPNGQVPMVDLAQDDDVESDDEVVSSGI